MVIDVNNEIILNRGIFQLEWNQFSEIVFPNIISKLSFIHEMYYTLLVIELSSTL